jgi:bifunctional non-homologous end joining protein LigD
MLATRGERLITDPDWVHELKWDGVRTLLYFDGRNVTLRSRAGNDATSRYPELGALRADRPVILDGEIVAFDAAGRPSFERLQQRMNLGSPHLVREAVTQVPVAFVVFDLLFDGVPLVERAWTERRERLEGLELPVPLVISEVVEGDPAGLWEFIGERQLEGVVAKRRSARYRPGVRSPDWRKITKFRQVRAVVGGYLPGEGGRSGSFGSLLLGLVVPAGLKWIGAVGSGFDNATLRAIRSALDQMETDEPPFVDIADIPAGAVWVKPQLVALVQYKEFTSIGRLRGPSFKGFTGEDPTAVTWEREGPAGPG